MDKYYKVKFADDGSEDIIKTDKTLYKDNYYNTIEGRSFFLLCKVNIKYTLEELELVRQMLCDYDRGTEQYMTYLRVKRMLDKGIPYVIFNKLDKNMLVDIYYGTANLGEKYKKVIEKIAKI